MRIRPIFPLVFLVGLAVCLFISLLAYNFLSVFYDYTAEGISIGAFRRIQQGLPYLSSLDSRPLYLNQYSPLYYLLHVPLLKVVPHTLKAVVLLGRCTSLLAGLAALRVAHLLGIEIFGKRFETLPFAIAAAFMLIVYPDLWNSVRPDLFAVCFEMLGLLFAVRSGTRRSEWHVAASAMCCGFAIALKFNQPGAVVIAATLIFLTRGVRLALRFCIISSFFLFAALLAGYIWAGALLFSNMAVVVQNKLLSPFEFALNLSKISQELFLGLLPLLGAAAVGLGLSLTLPKLPKLALFLSLPVFFVVATLGQVKAGAWVNYYHDFCLMTLVPATWGLSQTMKYLSTRQAQRRIGVVLACSIGFVTIAILARRTLYNAVFLRQQNLPYEEVDQFLKVRHPGLKIYTEDSSVAVHLEEVAWLGPGHETILLLTPKLAPTVALLREELSTSRPVGAVVASGADCQWWRPGGLFGAELHAMTNLEARFGRLCVFGPRE